MCKNIRKITLETYDNPGWGIKVFYDEIITVERVRLMTSNISEHNWIIQIVDQDCLKTAGDQYKLKQLLDLTIAYIKPNQYKLLIGKLLPELEWLSQWYSNECDDYWEHLYGVRAEIEKGQFAFTIDLDETDWENEFFSTVKVTNRYICEKKVKNLLPLGVCVVYQNV